jgi:hypothetical protein
VHEYNHAVTNLNEKPLAYRRTWVELNYRRTLMMMSMFSACLTDVAWKSIDMCVKFGQYVLASSMQWGVARLIDVAIIDVLR